MLGKLFGYERVLFPIKVRILLLRQTLPVLKHGDVNRATSNHLNQNALGSRVTAFKRRSKVPSRHTGPAPLELQLPEKDTSSRRPWCHATRGSWVSTPRSLGWLLLICQTSASVSSPPGEAGSQVMNIYWTTLLCPHCSPHFPAKAGEASLLHVAISPIAQNHNSLVPGL